MAIGIIDTGIDADNPEFAGRILAASTDVAANRGIQQEDDHGTLVALTAAAARDDYGILGIAFEATIMVLRADDPGSCASGDCSFFDSDIADGVDHAVANGARVINVSLGGGSPTLRLRNAIGDAAAAGVIVVVSASNDGASSPDAFATGLLGAGETNVIIAGSVDSSGTISDFSNRAGSGSAANFYLAALGDRICCVYNDSGNITNFLFSGTSFSAPQIAGAAALLAQAFPNLTGAEIVDLLLVSAFDAGDPGTDSVYGRGILDIAEAFTPQGTTSLAGGRVPIAIGETTGATSMAMGDATARSSLGAVILDGYDRAFAMDIGHSIRSASMIPRLTNALSIHDRHIIGGNNKASFAFTIEAGGRAGGLPWARQLSLTRQDADEARVLAGRIALKIAPDTQLGFAFAESAQGLVAQLQGQDRPAFFVAREATADEGFHRESDISVAMRRRAGPWGLTFSAESGEIVASAPFGLDQDLHGDRQRDAMQSYAFSVDREFGALGVAANLNWLREENTVLGARFHDAFGGRGADTFFLDALGRWRFAPGWRLGAAVRNGWTFARRAGLIAGGSQMVSRAWSLDLHRQGIFGTTDNIALRIAQPLRVERGGIDLRLPVTYDYASETATFGIRQLNLAPRGREIMGEASWSGPLGPGSATASLFYRRQPGHFEDLSADIGIAMRWSTQF